MKKERSYVSGFSAIGVTAAISVFILVSAIGWETLHYLSEKDAQATYVAGDAKNDVEVSAASVSQDASTTASSSSTNETTLGDAVLGELVSKYTSLQQQGTYTPEAGQQAAEQLAAELKPEVPYTQYGVSDVHADPDTTRARVRAYQNDLQKSLAPLLNNTQPEFEIFAYYVDTKDTKYLERLKEVAGYYRDAASAAAKISVPQDVVAEHVALLNALQQFAATLDAMATSANDPFASVVLLRTYNQAEADMVTSVNALTAYYKQKNT